MTNIQSILTSWGKSQNQLPNNNSVLKNQLLAQFDILPPHQSKQTFSLPWLSMAFGSLAIILLIAQTSNTNNILTPTQSLRNTAPTPVFKTPVQKEEILTNNLKDINTLQGNSLSNSAPTQDNSLVENKMNNSEIIWQKSQNYIAPDSIAPNPYFPKPASIPINDNRQFLKTDYNATVKTRHTNKITSLIQTTIKGYGGRIDTLNNSEKNSYISFVIPISNLDGFKQELRNIVGEKFIIENIFAENLLPEKQGIEAQQTQTSLTFNSLTTEKATLTENHKNFIANLNFQIKNLNKQLTELDNQLPPWSAEYLSQKQKLQSTLNSLQKQINNENINYQNNLNNLNEQIKYQENILTNLSEQDQNLLATVETVRGSISIQSINWIYMLNAYISLYWLVLILFGISVISYIVKSRKNHFPLV